ASSISMARRSASKFKMSRVAAWKPVCASRAARCRGPRHPAWSFCLARKRAPRICLLPRRPSRNAADVMKVRSLIVDDEAHARARLRQLLKDEPDFAIVGECANGRQALESVQQEKPDLIFLDVQMPRLSGFDVCEAVAA